MSGSPDRSDRLVEVESLYLSGATTAQLVKMARERWGVSDRQARRYVEQVAGHVKGLSRAERINAMQLAVYRRAMAAGKASAALGALDRMQKSESATDVPSLYALAGPTPMSDTLQGAAWMQRIMLLSVEEIVKDVSLSSVQRRDELRKTAARVAALVDFVDLDDANKRLKERDEEIENDRAVELEESGEASEATSDQADDEAPVFAPAPGGRGPRGRAL